jgi:hypothetical protein
MGQWEHGGGLSVDASARIEADDGGAVGGCGASVPGNRLP